MATFSTSLRFFHWNPRSLRSKLPEVQSILDNYDILIFVETWLSTSDTLSYPSFISFRKDRVHSRGGGILMLIRKSLVFTQLVNLSSPDDSVELCGFCLTDVIPCLDIIVCYRTPGHSLSQDQWSTIVNNVHNNRNW